MKHNKISVSICFLLALISICTYVIQPPVSALAANANNSKKQSDIFKPSDLQESDSSNQDPKLSSYSVELLSATPDVAKSVEHLKSNTINPNDKVAIDSYYCEFANSLTKNKSGGTSKYPMPSAMNGSENESTSNIISIGTYEILSEIPVDDYADYVPEAIDVKAYMVKINMTVTENNLVNFQGANYHVVICGMQDKVRKVLSVNLPLPYYVTLTDNDFDSVNNYLLQRFDNDEYEHIEVETETKDDPRKPTDFPSTIKVLMTPHSVHSQHGRINQPKGSRVDTVNFKDYCERVMASEFGYDDYPAAYHRAGALAVRNFAWYKHLAKPNNQETVFDVFCDSCDQNYKPEKAKKSNNVAGVAYIWNITMYTSDGKLFLSQYLDNTGGSGTGILREDTAHEMAVNGYTYQKILHYFYDNSTKNAYVGTTIGIIQIYCRGRSHAYSGTWSHTVNGHYHACNNNGCEMKNSYTAHTWKTVSSTTLRCTVCNYETSAGVSISSQPTMPAITKRRYFK